MVSGLPFLGLVFVCISCVLSFYLGFFLFVYILKREEGHGVGWLGEVRGSEGDRGEKLWSGYIIWKYFFNKIS